MSAMFAHQPQKMAAGYER
ncbi:Protein of unknown function [Thermobacillus xylanilyticus]|uniref:Uncharacterized protein n=1 Tax=Thermobacillus xylanilyticus TaxID=76633 RepID=A0ABN7RPE7_THEXY|nr:Protein of unknown function [Thermobacillus xylanilyticus]